MTAQPTGNTDRTRIHLTVEEVAELLRVSRWSVSRHIAKGRLQATKAPGPNGSVRIPLSALDDFLRRHTVGANTEETA